MVATGFRVSMTIWHRFLTLEGERGMTATESNMAKRNGHVDKVYELVIGYISLCKRTHFRESGKGIRMTDPTEEVL